MSYVLIKYILKKWTKLVFFFFFFFFFVSFLRVFLMNIKNLFLY